MLYHPSSKLYVYIVIVYSFFIHSLGSSPKTSRAVNRAQSVIERGPDCHHEGVRHFVRKISREYDIPEVVDQTKGVRGLKVAMTSHSVETVLLVHIADNLRQFGAGN